ncbi:MAG: transporter [Acidobacteria bacterium]|nr:MAG: transporter [Acidobacteriota bacterium]
MKIIDAVRLVIIVVSMTMVTSTGSAQELEPRAYRTMPTGLNALAFVYVFSSGNVVTEPSTPIEDLEAEAHTIVLGYVRSFGLFGRSANLMLSMPYVYMSASATLGGSFVEGDRGGWATPRARLAVNLLGGPALKPKEFAKYKQGRNLGVSLTVAPPGGQYTSDHLINFGTNRWGIKPEIGYSSIKGKWIFEGAVGVWVFTTNTDAPGGVTRQQNPIGSFQGHISYNFTPRLWMALNANYFTGGETTIDGVDKDDLQKNSRVGLTLSFAVGRRKSIKLAAHTGAVTSIGADFDIATIAYQVIW